MGEARTGVPRTYFFSFLVCIAAYIHTYIGEHVFIFLLCIYHSVVWVDWRELFLDQEIRVEFFFVIIGVDGGHGFCLSRPLDQYTYHTSRLHTCLNGYSFEGGFGGRPENITTRILLSTEEWSRCAFQEQIRNTKNSTLFIVHI